MITLNQKIVSVKGLFHVFPTEDSPFDFLDLIEIYFGLERGSLLIKCNGSKENLACEFNRELESVSLGEYGSFKIFDVGGLDLFRPLQGETLRDMKKLYDIHGEIGFRLLFRHTLLDLINWGDELLVLPQPNAFSGEYFCKQE